MLQPPITTSRRTRVTMVKASSSQREGEQDRKNEGLRRSCNGRLYCPSVGEEGFVCCATRGRDYGIRFSIHTLVGPNSRGKPASSGPGGTILVGDGMLGGFTRVCNAAMRIFSRDNGQREAMRVHPDGDRMRDRSRGRRTTRD